MKKLLLVIVSLLVILILAAVAAPYFISADTLKATLLQRIEAATGRHIQVDGKLQLRFFPVAGVTMETVTLSNPANYGDTGPLMTLKSLDVNVAVIPLLKGDIEIKKLVLDEPHINLHVTANGLKNWQSPPSAAPVAATTTAAAPSSSPMVLPRNLMLNNVKVTDGTVTYNDEAAKQQWTLQKLNAALSLNGVTSPFNIDASSEWNGKKVSVKGTLTTLQSLLNEQRTNIDADIESDLVSIDAHGFFEKSVYTGKTVIKSSSLKALQAWLQPTSAPIATPAALALNITSDMECSPHSFNFTNASVTLDKIEAKGSVKVALQTGQKPQIDANLTTGTLDFNPFLAAQHAASFQGIFADAYAETEGRWSDKPIDFSGMQAVNANVTIVADGLVFNKITLGKTTLRAKLLNGQLNADVIDAVMYGGKGNIAANVAAGILQSHITLKGVQVQPLLTDAAGMSRLSGTGDIDVNVNSHGKSERELVGVLAGSGQFNLANGAIERVNLSDMAHNVATAFKAANDAGQKTPITDMKGSFTIAQGVISNKDLVMTLPTLHISGQGDINLPAYTINYRMTPQLVQAATTAGAAAKEGVGIPVIIEGSLEKPTFRPDLNSLAQQALKNPQAFKDQLKNSRDTLKQQLKSPDAVNNLKGLLKGF